MQKLSVAQSFGIFLDQDEFAKMKELLAPDCTYFIHDEILEGKDTIAGLYQSNMEAGKKKFDELVWGESRVEALNENEFEVYFSDFLKHKGLSHNYNCKQKLTINNAGLITEIRHIELPGEREQLKAYYEKVGLT